MSTEQQVVDEGWEKMARAEINKEQDAINELRRKGPGKFFNAMHAAHLGIVSALKTIGIDATAQEAKWNNDANPKIFGERNWIAPKLIISELDYVPLDFVEERTRISSFRSEKNGKLRISYGHHGAKTSFPQRKDGTFNFEVIAQHIKDHVEHNRVVKQTQAIKAGNEDLAARINKQLKTRSYDSTFRLNASAVVERPVFVTCEIKRTMTPAQAMALFQALHMIGLVKQEGEA